MQKQAALSLSMEVLVVIIISIVILVGGISLLYKFIGGAEDIKGELDRKTQDELERLLVDQGMRVALPLHAADVQRGENHVFGLGILNTFNSRQGFIIQIALKKVVDETQKDITSQVNSADVIKWALYNADPIFLDPVEHRKEPILINVPKDAIKGQFIFSALVRANIDGKDIAYGNPQTFIVNVK
ncbi:MAG: hypothetical protein AB1668_05315 [Nanoarchaeota archaeon]